MTDGTSLVPNLTVSGCSLVASRQKTSGVVPCPESPGVTLHHVTNMSNVQQKLEDEITCPVCQDTFDNPKILPCGHYYCKRCVLQLAARKQPFPCPECRRDTHLPPGPTGVDEFPTAFFVNRMKSLHADLDHVESPDKKVEAEVATRAHQQSCVIVLIHVHVCT